MNKSTSPLSNKEGPKSVIKPFAGAKSQTQTAEYEASIANEEESKTPIERSLERLEQDSNIQESSPDLYAQSETKRTPVQNVSGFVGRVFNNQCTEHYNLLQNFTDKTHEFDGQIPLTPQTKFNGHTGKPVHFCWGNGLSLTNIISCDDMGQVIHWSGRRGKKVTVANLGVPLTWVDFAPQAEKLAVVGSTNGSLFLLELNKESKGRVVKGSGRTFKLDTLQGAVTACRFLSSNIVVSGSTQKAVCVYDFGERNSLVSKHLCHNGPITSIDVCEDDPNIFLTASTDKTCKIWDIRMKNPVQQEYNRNLASVNDIEFMPGMMSCFASGSSDGSIRIFDLRVTKEVAILIDQTNPCAIHSISFSPSGRLIVAGSEFKKVKVWDALLDADPFNYFDFGYQVGMQWTKLSKDGFTLGVLGKDGIIGLAI